ncbi:polynucleotide 5'-hydroxyl-kinase NOL9 isoform X1 [Astyanax mexicanus]|uniref:polynucleotide 5'-hydroxyl-kinase NOL9 isoform X1 n=1 Tax=Astyanax mexicanus TaxID=7994 RepID=UPI0020CB5ECA|nr:polynucleotide 5'-hydroxyl-kinase NOL9 isoform X1 [Astyanax mexicanus]XP_022532819.2 polynucleotide 5'-hydroxyl-kinase NOL9 isoform X1 [Astyanax mexicanus]XP_022532820.2 polynucleotide 5'-hydroxyl-kinase NOL9 isoform X1 [Astyanax mexicanus]XP_049318650.1 polynucleotide 5'-hydroxyl-kinase NOL9 isoform X1 [Astyanax mexicanus]
MKVHKKTRTKNEQQSASKHLPRNKWRVHNKKMRNYDPSHLSQSPATAKLEHLLGNKQKFKLKRLQKAFPKTVSMTAEEQVRKKEKVSAPATVPHGHTNGGMEVENCSESEDSQEWRSYAKSVLQNGTEKGGRGGRKNSTSAAPEPVENEEVPKYHAQHDHVQNHTVLALQQGQSLCFRGRCLLTCLSGRVEVLGFTIEQGQQPYPLFSPPSHCPLTITALEDCSVSTKNKKEGRLEAKAIIRKYLSSEPRKRLLGAVDCGSCVVLLQPLDTPLTRFLTSFSELDQLFDINSKELRSQAAVQDPALSAVGVTPLHGPCSRGLVASPSYREALSSLISAWEGDFDRCPIILVCGAKNSGKSTFNRHLINSLLNHTASVEYLECDLGQTEFTPPGCLSLSTVTEPLLGPPFTHQREPDHMVFYGQTDCQVDLDRYLDSLKTLWRHYGGENPIVINTMGWVKGLGFQVLVDLIRFFSVTHIVQLSYGDTLQCHSLTPEFLRSAQGWQTHPPAQPTLAMEPANHLTSRSHVLLSIHSEFEEAGTAGNMRHQRSNELRDLALLGYFSQLQSPEPGPIRPLHCFTPYQVPHSAVALGVTHCEVAPNHILYAANASLVALCCLGEKVSGRAGPVLLSQIPICQCVGFGVIRGIDMARGLYFLVTPVSPAALRQVNCLLLGEVTLPKMLLTVQPGVETELPYVTTDYSFDIPGAGKLHVFKGLKRPGYENAKMKN